MKTLRNIDLIKGLKRYSSFDDRPGYFLGFNSLVNAIAKVSGVNGKITILVAKSMIRNGEILEVGKVFIVK